MFRPSFVCRLAALCAALMPLSAVAEIIYEVAPKPEDGRLHVELLVPIRADVTAVQMPNWAPGSYRLVDNFANVKDLKMVDALGKELVVTKPNNHTWSAETPSGAFLRVSYSLPMVVATGAAHYSGPSTYVYVVDRTAESCRLDLNLPKDWKAITGLDENMVENTYDAPNYDVLADNPVTMGDYLLDSYEVRNKKHYIVLRGPARDDVDRKYLMKACKAVTEAQADFFGGLPYAKYVWHFNVNDSADGAGGLEHLSSTQISLASGVGPRVVSVISHEFFHLWNVKRIRSKPLGPFDYTKLPKTGALWWLEGVDDYYANLLLLRYGWYGEDMFLQDIVRNLTGVRANAARMEVSPNEASMRVGEASNGRGNSNGYRVSYYNTGWLVGLCLDTEIRFQTGGRRSLDDVMRALYNLTKDDKPGFEEDEIRKQCVRFGGQGLGPFYDKVVMQPGELPVEAQLAKVGLSLANEPIEYADIGFGWTASKPDGARVRGPQGPAQGKLQQGDLILEINGKSTVQATNRDISLVMQEQIEKAMAGVPLSLRVKRGDQTLDVTILPEKASRTGWRVTMAADADKTKRLREGWFYAGKRKPLVLGQIK